MEIPQAQYAAKLADKLTRAAKQLQYVEAAITTIQTDQAMEIQVCIGGKSSFNTIGSEYHGIKSETLTSAMKFPLIALLLQQKEELTLTINNCLRMLGGLEDGSKDQN